MEYNKNFGKIENSNVVKFAPKNMSSQELLDNGWLPIINNDLEHQNDEEYVYIAVGWEEIDGHIQKKLQRRKRLEYMRKYSKAEIVSRLGDTYQPFIQSLSQSYPELLTAFEQNTVYLESCEELHKCMKIYGEMYKLTDEQIEEQILVPSIVS